MPYSSIITDHIANPRNAGVIDDPTVVVEECNPVCGDRLRLSLRIRDRQVEAIRFLAYGCPPTIACGSALTELVEGNSIDAVAAITREELSRVLGGLPSRKGHAAALAIETLRMAIDEYELRVRQT